MESYLYFDSAPRYRTKSIDEISTGVAKRLKRMCSNDNDFLEQSKKYSAYLVAGNYKQKGITRTFYKFNKQSKSTIQQKRLKSSIKLGPSINYIIKRYIPIIIGNPNLIDMFPKNSIFWAYKCFLSLKDVMVTGDSFIIKSLKEVDQDTCCNDCMKRCDS